MSAPTCFVRDVEVFTSFKCDKPFCFFCSALKICFIHLPTVKLVVVDMVSNQMQMPHTLLLFNGNY